MIWHQWYGTKKQGHTKNKHVSLHALEGHSETLKSWFSDEEEVFTTPEVDLSIFQNALKKSMHTLSPVLTSNLLDKVIYTFDHVFAKPAGLLPKRDCDHQIHLLQGSNLVTFRPCRYPYLLKDEIERQCTEMLHSGVIRPSTSPFSSPVLLVKKSDNILAFLHWLQIF